MKQARSHLHSVSIESIHSLHRSIAESTNTLSCLVPKSPTKNADTTRLSGTFMPLTTRNSLPPEQRTMLLKRSRKLEHILGKPLDEKQTELLVMQSGVAKIAAKLSSCSPSPLLGTVTEQTTVARIPHAFFDGHREYPESKAPNTPSARPGFRSHERGEENEGTCQSQAGTGVEVPTPLTSKAFDSVQRCSSLSAGSLYHMDETSVSLCQTGSIAWPDEWKTDDQATRRIRRQQLAKVRVKPGP